MLYDLKPDESVTGGAWYSEQDFDYDFVEVLSANCLKFLRQKVLLLANIPVYYPLHKGIVLMYTVSKHCRTNLVKGATMFGSM